MFELILTLWLAGDAEDYTLATGLAYADCAAMLAAGMPEYVPSRDVEAPAIATRDFIAVMSCADIRLNEE